MKRSSLKRMLESSETVHENVSVDDVSKKDQASIQRFSVTSSLESSFIKNVEGDNRENADELTTRHDLERQFERLKEAILCNSVLRDQNSESPAIFASSELELVKVLKIFHAVPLNLALYAALPEIGFNNVLVDLLRHPNTDVSIEVLTLLIELTDQELVSSGVDTYCQSLIGCHIVPSLLRLLPCILASPEDTSVCLQFLSNLLDVLLTELAPQLATVDWISTLTLPLLQSPNEWSYPQSFSVDILSSVFYAVDVDSLLNIIPNTRLIEAVFTLLQSPLETELSKDLSNLVCVLANTSPKMRVLLLEGIPVIIASMRRSTSGIKMANDCLRDCETNCHKFVEDLGLKPLGMILMKQTGSEELVVSLVNSLVTNCTGISLNRIVSKFAENSFEKTARVLEIISKFIPILRHNELAELPQEEESEEAMFLRKCQLGLFTLQQACLVILRLFHFPIMRQNILKQMHEHQVPAQEIVYTVHEYIELLHPERSEAETQQLRILLVQFQSIAL